VHGLMVDAAGEDKGRCDGRIGLHGGAKLNAWCLPASLNNAPGS